MERSVVSGEGAELGQRAALSVFFTEELENTTFFSEDVDFSGVVAGGSTFCEK